MRRCRHLLSKKHMDRTGAAAIEVPTEGEYKYTGQGWSEESIRRRTCYDCGGKVRRHISP